MSCSASSSVSSRGADQPLEAAVDDIFRDLPQRLGRLHVEALAPGQVRQGDDPHQPPVLHHRRRRTCWTDISRVASRQSSRGETDAQPRVIMSRTSVWAGSSSAATHRSTISRSVTIPRSRRSAPHTGRAPTLCRLMSRAARAAEAVGSMVTTLGFINSFTSIQIVLSVAGSVPQYALSPSFLSLFWGPTGTLTNF